MYVYALNIVVSLSIALGALAWRTNNFSSFTYETDRRTSVEASPVKLSDWQLQNTDGETIHLSDLSNQLLLVDFVYTRCPTICRALGSRYEQLQRVINTSGNQKITLLSISIDPVFDTPKQLDLYQKRYSGSEDTWHLARPDNEQTLQQIISETGLRVISDEFGGLTHSDAIHLVKDRMLIKIESWDSTDWETLITSSART